MAKGALGKRLFMREGKSYAVVGIFKFIRLRSK